MTRLGRLPATEDLRCFVAAADELNFRRAAARVGLTPAALGQRVRQMEGRLEVCLFERTTRRVRLTEAGERLLPEARNTLDRLARMAEVVREPPGERRLAVAADARLGATWLMRAFDNVEEHDPRWQVELDLGAHEACLRKLSEGTADAVVVVSPPPLARWSRQELLELHFVLAASPKLLAANPLERAKQAASHTLLTASAHLLPHHPGGPRFERTRSCGDWSAARELASRGKGVALLPRFLAAEELQRGALVTVLKGFEGAPAPLCLLHSGEESVARLGSRLATELGSDPVR